MSLEIPTWDKIIGALGSTTSEIGGLWANLISDYYNGVDIGLLDPGKKPIIGTLTRYKFEKLGIFDTDQSHYIAFSADNIDTGGTRKIKFRRMDSPYEEDYAVLEGLAQELFNKIIDFSNNTASNLPGSAISDDSITNIKIKSDAAISTSKLADADNFALKNFTNIFTATQTINKASESSIAEQLQIWKVSDDANSFLSMENISATSNQFIPSFKSRQVTNNSFSSLYFVGEINSTHDSGSVGAMTHNVRTFNTTNQTLGAISNRILYNWQNNGFSKFQISNTFAYSLIAHRFDNYIEHKVISKPSDPASGYLKLYPKQIDANNDGLFTIIKKNGVFEEVQIA